MYNFHNKLSPEGAGSSLDPAPQEAKPEETKPEETKQEQGKPEVSPDPAQSKREEPQVPNFLTLPVPGFGDVQVTTRELGDLAAYGYQELKRKNTEPEKTTESVEPPSQEDQIKGLQRQITEMGQARVQDQELARTNSELLNASNQHEYTKDHPRLARSVNVEVLARVNMSPRTSITAMYAAVVKERVEAQTEANESRDRKATATAKVNSAMRPAQRSDGTPIIQAAKEYTAADLKGDTLRKALEEQIRAMQ